MRFIEWPWALALLIVLPAIGFVIFSAERRSRAERLAKLGTRSMLVRLAPYGARLGPGRTARITGALFLLGLAFAGPRWGLGGTVAHSNGVDVALALDASLSMLAPDAQPSRLENMKNVVRQLRAQSPNDRFALLAFAGHSYILSPLTTDQAALDLQLNNLTPATVGVAGTSLASVIKQATTLLSMRHGDASRAIILMSDGEDFENMADVTAEAKRAGEAGITLITVGFGTPQGSTIPIQDAHGGITMKKDRTGQTVVTKYDSRFLSQAAQSASHGVFIPAEAPNKADQIRHILNGIKTENRGAENGVDLAPRFQLFAFLGLLLLLLDTFIVLRPRRRVLTIATAALAATGCAEHKAPPKPAAPPPPPYVALYNKGTKRLPLDSAALKKDMKVNWLTAVDTLKKAIQPLDSATQSSDAKVRYRAGFNGGWSSFASAMEMVNHLQEVAKANSLPKLDSAATAVIATDSEVANALAAQLADTSQAAAGGDSSSGGDNGMGGGDNSAGGPPATSPQAKAQAKMQAVSQVIVKQLDNAVQRYRVALMANPNDADAKWNYELALITSKAKGGKGGKGGKSKNNKNGKSKKNNKSKGKQQQKKQQQKQPGQKKKGKSNQAPPIERLKLPEQQAQQLLNASGQNEQKALKAVPVPATPVPQGKDW